MASLDVTKQVQPPGDVDLNHQRECVSRDNVAIMLTEERFFEELNLMFEHAQGDHQRSWESFTYRPWAYILATWCLTFAKPGTTLSCGPQHPFLHRMVEMDDKVVEYCVPDFVLTLSSLKDGVRLSEVFCIVEAKSLPDVIWDSIEAREKAIDILKKAVPQTEEQARLAFLQHEQQQGVMALIVCGVWWTTVWFSRNKMFSSNDSGTNKVSDKDDAEDEDDVDIDDCDDDDDDDDDWTPGNDVITKKRKSRRTRSSKPGPRKKVKGSLHHVGAFTVKPSRNAKSEGADNLDNEPDDEPAGGPDETEFPVLNVMQLGSKKALNPWFKAFLGHLVDISQDITRLHFQKSWYRNTFNEELSGIRWDRFYVAEDDGHEEGYTLPHAEDLPADVDTFTKGVKLLIQRDGPNPVDTDGNEGFPSYMPLPGMRLAGASNATCEEDIIELADLFAKRMKTKGSLAQTYVTPPNRGLTGSMYNTPPGPVPERIMRAIPIRRDLPRPDSPSDRIRPKAGSFAIPGLPASQSAHVRSQEGSRSSAPTSSTREVGTRPPSNPDGGLPRGRNLESHRSAPTYNFQAGNSSSRVLRSSSAASTRDRAAGASTGQRLLTQSAPNSRDPSLHRGSQMSLEMNKQRREYQVPVGRHDQSSSNAEGEDTKGKGKAKAKAKGKGKEREK